MYAGQIHVCGESTSIYRGLYIDTRRIRGGANDH